MPTKSKEHPPVDGVPVKLLPQKKGTPIIKIGTARPLTASFRKDERPGAPDIETQVRRFAEFERIRSALSSATAAGAGQGESDEGGHVNGGSDGGEEAAGSGSCDADGRAAAERSAELAPPDSSGDDLFTDAAAFLLDVGSNVQSPRKRKRSCAFSFPQSHQLRDGVVNGKRKQRRQAGADQEASSGECMNPTCIQVRDERDQLKRRHEVELDTFKRLREQLHNICEGLADDQLVAAKHVQLALLHILDEEEGQEEEEEEETGANSGGRGEASGEASGEAREAVLPAAATLVTQVATEGGIINKDNVNAMIPASKVGEAEGKGALALRDEELLWAKLHETTSSWSLPLSQLKSFCTRRAPRSSPFSPPSTHIVFTRRDNAEELFDVNCISGSLYADVEAFLFLVGQVLSERNDAGEEACTSTAAAQSATASAPTCSSTNDAEVRLTKRVRAGNELREQLQRVARLRHSHKMKAADELFASLGTMPADERAAKREDGLAKQRVRELRDCCFSMGGLSLTQRVLDRFLSMPEVRLLLPEAVRKERQELADAQTSKLLLDTAKAFLSKIFKARSAGLKRPGEKGGGRRNDEDRNAFLAALAALLPADLFENHRGRAAMRILGISYRQARQGSQIRGELEDRGRGWKRIKTATHSDKVDYAIVREFWHSELASVPDNQNKCKVRVELGIDSKTGERLYDLHEQRAQCGTARALFQVFRGSAFAARLREATRTPKRPNGVKLGWRQFLNAKCDCIKERKASECDCQDCTYVTQNLSIWHRARRGWFQQGRESCSCRYHQGGSLELKYKIALDAEVAAWVAAGEAAAEDSSAQAVAAESASAHAMEAAAAIARRDRYEGFTRDIKALHAALLPCGKVQLPQYTETEATTFATYKRDCVYGNCQQRIFRGAKACGWDNQFPVMCPLETSEMPFSWRVWEMRLSGNKKHEDEEPSYTPEFSWSHGTRAKFVTQFREMVEEWLPHVWRDSMQKQGLRVFEDRKSGRHYHLAHKVHALAEQCSSALKLVARNCMRPSPTLKAVARIAAADEAATAKALEVAERVHNAAARTATIQSDYAAQIQTKRSHTATCARPERHNCLVSVVGYKPYCVVPTVRGAKKRKARGSQPASDRYRQHVDVFFAFHDAGYKPSARSFNVAREDIDHFLKHGTFLYGEWFTDGARCPGGDRSEPLPESLSERATMAPDFPEYEVALEPTDGAPTQFANATNHHQTAAWRTKTGIIRRHAKHVEHHGKSACDGFANVPTHTIKDAVRTGAVLDPTTRKCVRYLAEHMRRPIIPKHLKRGWEAADRYFVGYMPPAKFTKHSVPDAEAGRSWKSKADQEVIGLCEDRALAEKEGPLRAGRLFCGCDMCTLLKFEECTMKAFVGRKLRHITPLAKGVSVNVPQLVALSEWAGLLKPGMLVAVNVPADLHGCEGAYWLAKLLTCEYQLPEDVLWCGQEFKEGWLVADAQWYKLEKRGVRGYKLLPEKTLILVNAMVRLSNLKFSGSRGGPQQRELRSGGLSFLGDDEHYAIEENLTFVCA